MLQNILLPHYGYIKKFYKIKLLACIPVQLSFFSCMSSGAENIIILWDLFPRIEWGRTTPQSTPSNHKLYPNKRGVATWDQLMAKYGGEDYSLSQRFWGFQTELLLKQ